MSYVFIRAAKYAFVMLVGVIYVCPGMENPIVPSDPTVIKSQCDPTLNDQYTTISKLAGKGCQVTG